jgi:DNA-binding MarR family transcriptional regulator
MIGKGGVNGVPLGAVSAKTAREAWRAMQDLLFTDGPSRMHAACAVASVPPGVLKTLLYLNADEPTAMRDIAAYFGVDASYVTSLVDELENNGLAERRPHPTDRRVKTIALTAKGIEAQRRAQELMWEPPASFGALTQAEQTELARLLRKLADADGELKSSRVLAAGRQRA